MLNESTKHGFPTRRMSGSMHEENLDGAGMNPGRPSLHTALYVLHQSRSRSIIADRAIDVAYASMWMSAATLLWHYHSVIISFIRLVHAVGLITQTNK